MYFKRQSTPTLHRYLESFPVVGVTGPRQSGKSTLLLHTLPHYTYVTFDDELHVLAFENDPKGFLKQYANKVIFDEVQFVPKIFNAIKMLVDTDRQNYGRFILTGSSQFAFLKNVSESLAGRIGLMTQLPLQFLEVPDKQRNESIYRGAYPELVLNHYHNSDLWFSSYMDTYLTKDVRALMQIGDMRDFRRLIQLLASNVSQTLDLSSYANNIGVSVPTIKRWVSVLEASYIIFLLPPYYNNFGKRIVKSPKIYFYDTGMISYLTGVSTYELYDKGPLAGPIFENYIISEIQKKIRHQALQYDLYYLRTQDKAEIDLILDKRTHQEFIEIKKSHTYKPKMSQTLQRFAGEQDIRRVIYMGESLKHGDVQVSNYMGYLSDKDV